MTKLRFLPALMLLLIGAFGFAGCDNDDDDIEPADQNLVEFLAADSDYELLSAALVKADLVATLSAAGPFTLFAPDDDAFQAFLDAAGTNTIENTPQEVLVDILSYHVLGGELEADDLVGGGFATTLSESDAEAGAPNLLYINTDNGITLNGEATVTKTDIDVENGVIHAIDQVLGLPNVVTFVTSVPDLSMLEEALTMSGLTTDFIETLSGNGPFTIFAPSDQAFQALLDTNPDWNSLADIPVETLERVLMFHVSGAANYRATELTDELAISTLAGENLIVNIVPSGIEIVAGGSSADVINQAANIQANNGVIHFIDAVLLPE